MDLYESRRFISQIHNLSNHLTISERKNENLQSTEKICINTHLFLTLISVMGRIYPRPPSISCWSSLNNYETVKVVILAFSSIQYFIRYIRTTFGILNSPQSPNIEQNSDVMWIYGWNYGTVSHHLAIFDGYWSSTSKDIKYLTWDLTLLLLSWSSQTT